MCQEGLPGSAQSVQRSRLEGGKHGFASLDFRRILNIPVKVAMNGWVYNLRSHDHWMSRLAVPDICTELHDINLASFQW